MQCVDGAENLAEHLLLGRYPVTVAIIIVFILLIWSQRLIRVSKRGKGFHYIKAQNQGRPWCICGIAGEQRVENNNKTILSKFGPSVWHFHTGSSLLKETRGMPMKISTWSSEWLRPSTFRIREEGRGTQETCFLVKVGIRALFLGVGNREGRAYMINQMPLQIYSAQHRFTQKEGRKERKRK